MRYESDDLLKRTELLLNTAGQSSEGPSPLLEPVRDFLGRGGKRFRTRLVEMSYRLAGGLDGGPDPALGAAVELLHAGSLIVDDIQDASEVRRGQESLHRRFGVPMALNTGNWLYFAAMETLLSANLAATQGLAVQRLAVRTLLRCHQGQGLDLDTRVDAVSPSRLESMVAQITGLKTAELMRFAAQLGAYGADATADVIEAVGTFGYHMGIALQMLDDRSGVLAADRKDKGLEDLRLRRVTWPWAWAHAARGPEFVEVLQRQLRWGT
ncbi:MAG: polyprenyl synthetase family protein, partial [Myxococcales bacterium]|nr:polyprenyl synthetase family protein [Myxococcales bacterium]